MVQSAVAWVQRGSKVNLFASPVPPVGACTLSKGAPIACLVLHFAEVHAASFFFILFGFKKQFHIQ